MTIRLTIIGELSNAVHVDMARAMMHEYAALPHTVGRWPTVSADLAALPAPFLPPRGALLVATDDGHAIGCGALLQLGPGIVEMKRVYVRPTARGRGIGEALVKALLDHAVALGFTCVRLDTAPELHAAISLYRRLGFRPIPQYREGLLPDAVCMERALDAGSASCGVRLPSG